MIKKWNIVPIVLTGILVALYIAKGFWSVTNYAIKTDDSGNFISEHTMISENSWMSISPENSGYMSPEILLAKTDNYVDSIVKTLNLSSWSSRLKELHGDDYNTRIKIEFTYDVSQAVGGWSGYKSILQPGVKLNIKRFENGSAPLVHELTHVITPISQSLSLEEGLACYMQDLFGENSVFPNYGENIHDIAKGYISKENNYIIAHIGNTLDNVRDIYYSQDKDTMVRGKFYVFSSSFVRYLIETYGVETFMSLYTSEELNVQYKALYEKSLDELILEWKNHLLMT